MKNNFKKSVCIMLAAIMTAVILASCGVDPNVKQEEEATKDYSVNISEGEKEKELTGFHSYPSGKTDPVKVNGVEVSVTDFSLRAYELAYMLAQKNFASPDKIPIDALVQFAFCHVYYKNLNEMNNKAMQYRSAKEEQIKEQLKTYFGSDNYKITDSALYNSGKKIFEMWIPEYGCNIYYTVDAVNVSGDNAEIITTFYNELERESMLGRTTINVKVKDGKPVIASLSSK